MKKNIFTLVIVILLTLFSLWYLFPNNSKVKKLEEKKTQDLPSTSHKDELISNKTNRISEQYLEMSKYPPYSIPISIEEVQGYTGNIFNKVSYPLTEHLILEIILPKFHFEIDEDIPLSIEIKGRDSFDQKITASILESNQSITLKNDDYNKYSGVLKSKMTGENKLTIHTVVDGKEYNLRTSVIVDPNLGKIKDIGLIEIKGNELIIPLNFDKISKDGDFRISGNLYKNNQPIVHFYENFNTQKDNTANIKIYGSLLAGESLKNLSIKDLVLEKLPKSPDERSESTYIRNSYNLSVENDNILKDIPYVNKNVEEASNLLKALS
jgi:hypothetical protein